MRPPNYYSPVGGLGISYLGQNAGQPAPPDAGVMLVQRTQTARYVWGAIAVASGAASAYHGYKRSRGSTGSAVGWGLLGTIFPIIVPAVALAQGFGKPKVTRNRRRTSRRRS